MPGDDNDQTPPAVYVQAGAATASGSAGPEPPPAGDRPDEDNGD